MSELRACIEAAAKLRAEGQTCLIATVVDVRGSSYRKPGARMVFSEERWLAGSVSGGCLERDVLAKGAYRTRGNRAQLVTYDAASDERSGSGCDGVIDVLVERAACAADDLTDPLSFAERCLRDETPGILCTVIRSERPDVRVGAHHTVRLGDVQSSLPSALHAQLAARLESVTQPTEHVLLEGVTLLVEQIVPPVHLFLFGGAHDAVPVVTFAKALGWTTSVCEPHAQLSNRERFLAADHHRIGALSKSVAAMARCARPAALIMGHHYDRDLEALDAILRTHVPYVGLLGARKRAARLLDDLAQRGLPLDAAMRARLHAPVGIAIGAESPQEIALAIVAEVQAQVASRPLARQPTQALASA